MVLGVEVFQEVGLGGMWLLADSAGISFCVCLSGQSARYECIEVCVCCITFTLYNSFNVVNLVPSLSPTVQPVCLNVSVFFKLKKLLYNVVVFFSFLNFNLVFVFSLNSFSIVN